MGYVTSAGRIPTSARAGLFGIALSSAVEANHVFTDRTDFLAAAGSVVTEGFDMFDLRVMMLTCVAHCVSHDGLLRMYLRD
jgi:hypothetical protein